MHYKPDLRIKILRILKDTPTHGYDLWKNYNYEDFPQERSSFYRFLRTMARENLIKSNTQYRLEESNVINGKTSKIKKPKQKINVYSLTDEGLRYLNEYEKYILTQTIDIIFRGFTKPFLKLLDQAKIFGVKRFLYYTHTYLEFRETSLLSLIYPFTRENGIDLILMSDSPIPNSARKRYPNSTILDQHLRPNDHDIDFIFCPDLYMWNKTNQLKILRKFKRFLKPEPGLFLSFDMFVEIQGRFGTFLNKVIEKLEGIVPPIIPEADKTHFINHLKTVFPNIISKPMLDVNLLIATADPKIPLKKYLKLTIASHAFPFKIDS